MSRLLMVGGAVASIILPAWAALDPKNPNITLYEHPPQTATPTATPPAASVRLQQDANGFWIIDFHLLASFDYGHARVSDLNYKPPPDGNISFFIPDESKIIDPPTGPGEGGPIPAAVQALDGKRVRLGGFMLPIKVEAGLATQFLILRNQMMCCFGLPPAPNEWVVVHLTGKGVPSRMDTPLYFYGTLHVGEIFEDKVFEGLYQLDVEKVSPN